MASNKNQHFVPRCYLRPFALAGNDAGICLYNIDHQKFINLAPLKHQCSSDYFYGKDERLEKAIQGMEGTYGSVVKAILSPGYLLTDEHREFLKMFWVVQHLRTEAASRRAVESFGDMSKVAGIAGSRFRLEIREAVHVAMVTAAEEIQGVVDMKVCLLRNKTNTPLITSDDPAILTNRWMLSDVRRNGLSFGIHSAGAILLLPLSPMVMCIAYDGDVYSIAHINGWTEIRKGKDIEAFNEHQLLNCRANIFTHDPRYSCLIDDAYARVRDVRPKARHRISYAIPDRAEGNLVRYKVVDEDRSQVDEDALIHMQAIHPNPSTWPTKLSWRPNGVVYTNGTGIGYVRRAWAVEDAGGSFRKVAAH